MQAVSEKSYSKIFVPNRGSAIRFKFESRNGRMKFTDDEFWKFCRQNDEMRIEMTKEGDVIIMPPTGWEMGDKNSEINLQLRLWAKKDKRGKVGESSTGFKLPNGATVFGSYPKRSASMRGLICARFSTRLSLKTIKNS